MTGVFVLNSRERAYAAFDLWRLRKGWWWANRAAEYRRVRSARANLGSRSIVPRLVVANQYFGGYNVMCICAGRAAASL